MHFFSQLLFTEKIILWKLLVSNSMKYQLSIFLVSVIVHFPLATVTFIMPFLLTFWGSFLFAFVTLSKEVPVEIPSLKYCDWRMGFFANNFRLVGRVRALFTGWKERETLSPTERHRGARVSLLFPDRGAHYIVNVCEKRDPLTEDALFLWCVAEIENSQHFLATSAAHTGGVGDRAGLQPPHRRPGRLAGLRMALHHAESRLPGL
jgi:hypothetical protein